MRCHNICFHGEIRKITFELSSVPGLFLSFALYDREREREEKVTGMIIKADYHPV